MPYVGTIAVSDDEAIAKFVQARGLCLVDKDVELVINGGVFRVQSMGKKFIVIEPCQGTKLVSKEQAKKMMAGHA